MIAIFGISKMYGGPVLCFGVFPDWEETMVFVGGFNSTEDLRYLATTYEGVPEDAPQVLF